MCGFTGFWAFDDPSYSLSQQTIKRMNDALTTRGPDSEGFWDDAGIGVFLGHRRLAIQDLSEAGHQPMLSPSSRFVLAFNGEIYNHLTLRQEIEADFGHGYAWRGHSDTETITVGFEHWGIEKTVKKLVGMFAFAVWDQELKKMTLGRDRLGEKPLYYGWKNNNLLFGSELKALKQHPCFSSEIDRGALCLFMRHNCIPAPYSIYENIFKLEPGKLKVFSFDRTETSITYWSGDEVSRQGQKNRFHGSASQAVNELESRLLKTIDQQMLSDVPLGGFLSGGIDSSVIVALMQANSSHPINTFTIGFDDKGYNEAIHASKVASHIGTNHHELYVTPEQALDVIPSLPVIYDEPFADSSQIPTYLVSQLAKQHVTVALSGDGGDELFSGYNRYLATQKVWGKLTRIPQPLRQLSAKGLTSITPSTWTQLGDMLPERYRMRLLGDKIHKGASVISAQNVGQLYRGLTSQWKDPADVVLNGYEPATLLTEGQPDLSSLSDIEKMMALDMLTYMPDDILTKVDRAAMSMSLETRVPLLDHHTVEFAWSLPMEYKIRDGQTKWVLREVLYRHVPKLLIERPKMGFGIPVDDWLRGPLRSWAEALLDEGRLQREGYFEPKLIRRCWSEHLSGKYNRVHQLWCVLMFQAWLETQ